MTKRWDPEIPLNRVFLTGREVEYFQAALESGRVSGDGPFTERCQALLEGATGAPKALLTTSCTHALEMAAILLDVEPGDEIVVPSFTFVSTANAFVLRGARPVFVDVREETGNLDPTLLEGVVGPATRAIVVVHYAGVGCEMEEIAEVSRAHGVPIVEDNAHGLFGGYRDRVLGTIGDLAAQSFHETKNFSCGEGGALLINRPELVERAEIVREKGTDRKRFFRGEVDRYTWRDLGSSYLPSDLLAAVLLAQLEAREEIQRRRERIWRTYERELAEWARANGVRRPHVPAECDPAYHLYYLIMPSREDRGRFIASLRERGVFATFHYVPLHLSEMGRRFGARPGDCPVTEEISARMVRLPFYTGMSESEQSMVIEATLAFRSRGNGGGA